MGKKLSRYADVSIEFFVHIRVFPKIDLSGSSARIVLEQDKFSKKVTSNRDWTCDPRTVVLTCYYLQSHAFPSELSWQVLIEGYLTQLKLFVHQLTFGLIGLSWNQ